MGEVRTPRFVTPLVAMLAGDPAHFEVAKGPLEALFGPIGLESPLYPFDKTDYYAASMGAVLHRKFFSFERLADPGELAGWKLATNAMEADVKRTLCSAAPPRGTESLPNLPERPVNLDVGYITGAKLVLASTKDFAHRLYLRDGIFAEITLSFRGDSWVGHQFTFPDFKSGMYDAFLKQVRDRHLRKVKDSGQRRTNA
ncbi:MAG: DUF4416 family protein [Planctomycetota bacterium]|nr:DUF4416 family protein [Planctomycetota bacterium]